MVDVRANPDLFRARSGRRPIAAAAVLAIGMTGAQAAPAEWPLSADAWAVPRQAETILSMTPVVSAVQALLADPRGRLTLLHPAGEEGALWAAELRAWLVGLGVDTQRIQLRAAAAGARNLTLSVAAAPARGVTP